MMMSVAFFTRNASGATILGNMSGSKTHKDLSKYKAQMW